MKKIACILVVLLVFSSGVWAQQPDSFRLKGQIKGYKGGLVSLIWYVGYIRQSDTLTVDKNGSFDHISSIDRPSKMFLYCGDYEGGADLFAENGMVSDMQVSFHPETSENGTVYYVADVIFSGDNADCKPFLQASMDLMNRWPFSRLDTIKFTEYRKGVLEDIDSMKCCLNKVKSVNFRRFVAHELDEQLNKCLYRFAWSKPREDADFSRWAESFDRNDPENIDITNRYLRWYRRIHPLASGESEGLHYFRILEKAITDEGIRNDLADKYIQKYMINVPKDLEEVYQAYLKISTDSVARAQSRQLFEHYRKLMPGALAADFEMVGTDGKTYHLSDLRGKAVFIDVWATWCVPCCAELPYVAKLVEHYKGNKKIEFVSISLDKDTKAWQEKLAKDKFTWRHFICMDNFESALCKNYDIYGIPRFLFFDKKGRVISLNAPRPSSEKIIEFIDSHLK